MTRAFTSEPVAPATIDEMLDAARRAPSAGNTQALTFLVLEGGDVAAYWDVTLPATRRQAFPWPDLLRAPLLVMPFVDPGAYTARYAEGDKAAMGLGGAETAWSTPYWWVDGGMAAMTILLAVQDRGLGALFFAMFDHEDPVKAAFGVPQHMRALGTIAIGHPAETQRPSRSSARPRPPLDDVVHRGHWGSQK